VETREALDRFLTDVERTAFRMARLATGSTDDALDIVQDTMIKLVEKYASKPPEEWRPLFFRILQSRIADYHRQNSTSNRIFSWLGQREGDETAEEHRESAVPVGPLDELTARLTAETLLAVLAELPRRQQQVFLLRVWEGFSVTETARIMNCAEGSVKTHLSRAMAAIKRAVAADERLSASDDG